MDWSCHIYNEINPKEGYLPPQMMQRRRFKMPHPDSKGLPSAPFLHKTSKYNLYVSSKMGKWTFKVNAQHQKPQIVDLLHSSCKNAKSSLSSGCMGFLLSHPYNSWANLKFPKGSAPSQTCTGWPNSYLINRSAQLDDTNLKGLEKLSGWKEQFT